MIAQITALAEFWNPTGLRVEHPGGSIWAVRGAGHGVAATLTWGTERRPARRATLDARSGRRTDQRQGTRRASRSKGHTGSSDEGQGRLRQWKHVLRRVR